MTVLSYNEGVVQEAVWRLAGSDPNVAVAADDIRHRAWQNGYGLNYDQVQRALRGLVEKGALEKPKRGWYRRRHCPDDGVCHHSCAATECFRVQCCEPLSVSGWGEAWPTEVKERYG